MTSDSHLPQSLRALCVTERQDLDSDVPTADSKRIEPSRAMFHHTPSSRLQVPRSLPRLQSSPIIHGRDGPLLDVPNFPRPRERSPGHDFWEKMSRSPEDRRRRSRPSLDRRLSSMSPMDQRCRRASRSRSPIDTPRGSFERRPSMRDYAQTRHTSLHPASLPLPHHSHHATGPPSPYMCRPFGDQRSIDPNSAYSRHHLPEIDRRHSYQPETQCVPLSTRPNTSYESVQPGGRVQIKRRSMACVACKEKKIRCESLDGQTWPCLRCRKRDIPCEFPGAQKKRGPQPGTTRPNTSTSARKGSGARKTTTPDDTTPPARPALSRNPSSGDNVFVSRTEKAAASRAMICDDESTHLRPISERQQEHSGRSVTPAFESDLPTSTSARNSIGSLDSSLLTPEEEQDERRNSYNFGLQTATYRSGAAEEYLQLPQTRSLRLGSGDMAEGRKHSIDYISSPDASRRGSLFHSGGNHTPAAHGVHDRPPMVLPAPTLRSPWQSSAQQPSAGQPSHAVAHYPSFGPSRMDQPLDPHRRSSAPHSGLFDAAYSLSPGAPPSRVDPRGFPTAKRHLPTMGEESMFGPDGLTLPPLEGLARARGKSWKP